MIDSMTIAAVVDRLHGLSDKRYAREADRLFDLQPQLTFAFFEMASDLPESVRVRLVDTYTHLLAIVEKAHPEGIAEVSSDTLHAAMELELERAIAFERGTGKMSASREPEALEFIFDWMEPEKGDDEAGRVTGSAILALKAALDCLTDAAGSWRSAPVAIAPRATSADRNDPCPCGSGKKYKKCCLASEDEARAPKRSPLGMLEDELVAEVETHARRNELLFDDPLLRELDPESGLIETLGAWHVPSRGRSLSEHFFEARGARLAPRLRAWYEAQRAAWLSIWEVVDVEPGKGMTLRDLLGGETRAVREATASTILSPRLAILARVVDFEGTSQLFGVDVSPLDPIATEAIVARWRRKFGSSRKEAAARLRTFESVRALALWWDEAVEDELAGADEMPDLRNSDGDEILFTRERFTFDEKHRQLVVMKLGAIECADIVMKPEEGPLEVVLLDGDPETAPEGSLTLLARIEVRDGELLVETNSIARADSARATIETALGSLVRRRLRDHVDPGAMLDDRIGKAPMTPTTETDPEIAEVMRRTLKQHYATWPDMPIPALKGKTPREAARTKAGRAKVVALLRSFELAQDTMPEGPRYDFRRLYEELGIDYE